MSRKCIFFFINIIICSIVSITIGGNTHASNIAIKEPISLNDSFGTVYTNDISALERELGIGELLNNNHTSSDSNEEDDSTPFYLFDPQTAQEDPVNVIEEGTLRPVEVDNLSNKIKNIGNLRVLTTITDINTFKQNQKYVYELMKSYNKPVCIIDTETTGTYKYIDRLIQLAVMKFSFIENGTKVKIEVTNQYFNPGDVSISHFAYKAHKLDKDFLANFNRFKHYAKGVIKLLDDSIWLAHNVGFDFWKLREELERELPQGHRMKVITKCTLKKTRRDNKRRSAHANNNLELDGKTFESPAAKQKYINSKTEEFFKEKEEHAYKTRFINKIVREIKRDMARKGGRYIVMGKKAFINRVIKDQAMKIFENSDINSNEIKNLDLQKVKNSIVNSANYIVSDFATYLTNNRDMATSSSSDSDSSESSTDSDSESSRSPSPSDELSLSQSSNDSSNSLSSLSSVNDLSRDEFFQKYFNKDMKTVAAELNIPARRINPHDAFYDITMLESLIRNKFIITKHPNKPVLESARRKRSRNSENSAHNFRSTRVRYNNMQ